MFREEREESEKLKREIKERMDRYFEKDFKRAVDHPYVRRVIWQILTEAGPWKTTFSEDPYKTAFLEGKRYMGLMIMGFFTKYSWGDYIKMQKEYSDEVNQIKLEMERINGNRSDE